MSHSDGILLVDKLPGCTSHDVVAQARRALGQREVGHAGTLDPMATGLLVLLAGEATKLSAYLTADRKAYCATLRFGAETDTLDAEGVVTARSDAPSPSADALRAALASMVGPMMQVPPAVSAIKQGGVPLHERVRRGEAVEVAPREVVLDAARVLAVREGECDIELECSKGFYVRSFARDVARKLGTLGHLAALRRMRSGVFDVSEALAGEVLSRAARGEEAARAWVRAALLPLGAAARAMRALIVDEASARALEQGKTIERTEPVEGVVFVCTEGGEAVCIGEVRQGRLRVLRGFVRLTAPSRGQQN